MSRSILLALVILATSACYTTVQLHVENPTKQAVSIAAIDQSNGSTAQHLNLGSIVAGGHADPASFKVKHNHDLVLQATALGYNAWQSSPTTITSSPDPRSITETVNIQATLLDDASAIQQINGSFSNIGPTYGLNPLSADNAVATYWGALMVIVPATQGNPVRVVYTVPPNIFLRVKGAVSPTPKLQYPATNNTQTVDISGKAASDLSVTLPILKAAGNFQQTSVYQLQWQLLGFGEVDLPTPDGWSLGAAIAALSDGDRNNIGGAIQANQGAILLFVDKFYVLQSGTLSQTQGSTLSTGASLSASTVLESSGAYTFSNQTTNKTNFANVVLNIFGDVLSANIIKITTPPISAGAAARSQAIRPTLTLEGVTGTSGISIRGQVLSRVGPLTKNTWTITDVRKTGLSISTIPRSALQ